MSNKHLSLMYHPYWVTANTFFGSKAAAKARGFDSVEQMDEAILKAFNHINQGRDQHFPILHLGNFAVARKERVANILSQIRTPLLLCRGKFDDGIHGPNLRIAKTLTGAKALSWHDYNIGSLSLGTENEVVVRTTLSSFQMVPMARGVFLISSGEEQRALHSLDQQLGNTWRMNITAVIDLRITSDPQYGDRGLAGKAVCVNTDLNPEPVSTSRLHECFRGARRYAQRDDRPASFYGFLQRTVADLDRERLVNRWEAREHRIHTNPTITHTATATTTMLFDGRVWRNAETTNIRGVRLQAIAVDEVTAGDENRPIEGTITGRLEPPTTPAPAPAANPVLDIGTLTGTITREMRQRVDEEAQVILDTIPPPQLTGDQILAQIQEAARRLEGQTYHTNITVHADVPMPDTATPIGGAPTE